jgi:hypothetical protein
LGGTARTACRSNSRMLDFFLMASWLNLHYTRETL